MGSIAPDELKWLANEWELAIPSAVFSGIVGDSAHTYGYHLSWNAAPANDYSKKLPRDVNNIDVNAADALDMSMNDADMKMVTRRLYDSWKDQNDPRLDDWREAIGTLDGKNVIYMDTQDLHQGTSDSSHLWHVHVGGLRSNAHSMSAMRGMLSVVKGQSYTEYKNQGAQPMNGVIMGEQLLNGWPVPVTADGKPDGRGAGVWTSEMWRYLWDGKGAYDSGHADPAGPASGFYLDKLLKNIRDEAKAANANTQLLLAQSATEFSQEQLMAIAVQIGNILAQNPDTPITESDLPKLQPVMVAAVKEALLKGAAS